MLIPGPVQASVVMTMWARVNNTNHILTNTIDIGGLVMVTGMG